MFRFPLWLCLISTCLPVVCCVEGMAPLLFVLPRGTFAGVPVGHQIWGAWIITAPYGFVGGIVLCLGAVGFDALRNGRRGTGAALRVGSNLFWCLLYATVLIILNDALFFLLWKQSGILLLGFSLSWTAVVPFALCVLFNIVSVLWAITRSITTTDVLTPRVLGAKLRRSVKMMG